MLAEAKPRIVEKVRSWELSQTSKKQKVEPWELSQTSKN